MNNIGIIGFGNMGSCLGERLKSKEHPIWTFDKDKKKTEKLSGINLADSNIDLVREVETIILAVKPQDFGATLDEIKNETEGKLVISIAAGITTGYIEKILGKVRVIRTMPNMPARIGRGITCLCKGQFATEKDSNFTRQLFENLGLILILEEDMINEATAVSGSGPGYVFDLIETKKIDINNKAALERFREEFTMLLIGAAIGIGFMPKDATKLAQATVDGSIALLKYSKLSAQELRKQITSKGGTTEAALEVLHRGGDLDEAVKAAVVQARQLAKK
ncbi:MAG: pyrroline-5-carboxylate reductase [Candidatus Omnitrophica bacterium]|nr:pyrroline-5-carboxylate reductase [Candidatus Omnitrophota bacterium]